MPKPFTDNQSKRVVREKWDTPILRHLHDKYGARYRYMGLPGVDLIDVKLWKNMIDEVIAFEPPDRSGDRRKSIKELRRNLKLQGIPGIAYYGSMEEVITLRQDFDGQRYSQAKVITLYNLDFCSEIASSIDTREQGKKVLRFEAIRQVLRDQAECYRMVGGPNYFILMLTVRNQIGAKKIHDFLNAPLLAEAERFRDECGKIVPIPNGGILMGSHAWALKAHLFNFLCMNFTNPNLSALLFPLVLYEGTPIITTNVHVPSPMIHWVILCRFGDDEGPAPRNFPNPFLPKSSVVVMPNGALSWKPQAGETNDSSSDPDCIHWLHAFGGELLNDLQSPHATRG